MGNRLYINFGTASRFGPLLPFTGQKFASVTSRHSELISRGPIVGEWNFIVATKGGSDSRLAR